jgi:H/ACA ribonucleoprotein complex subunit 4
MALSKKAIKELLEFGIIIIDKSSGPTSFTVSEYVKKQLGLRKTSHFGTLDPKVTGVLPVALNRACKLTGFFLGHNKTYVGIIRTHTEQSMKKLQEIIDKKFIGKIMQLPPKKSRVKREIREREILSFKLIEEGEDKKDFLFITQVQGGTYIRKLIHDLGIEIDGAHMLELRRTEAGIFDESKIVNLYDFKKAVDEFKEGKESKLKKLIIPADEALKEIFEVIEAKKTSVKHLLTGKPLWPEDIIGDLPKEQNFAVFSDNQFIEIAKKVEEGSIMAKPLFVFN